MASILSSALAAGVGGGVVVLGRAAGVPQTLDIYPMEGGALTQMTEQLPAGERVTAYSYTDGRLTKAVETLGQLVRTTTYNYQAGILTGFTTTEGGA